MVSKQTRSKIKGYIEGFVQGLINETIKSGLDPQKPRPPRMESKKGDIRPSFTNSCDEKGNSSEGSDILCDGL